MAGSLSHQSKETEMENSLRDNVMFKTSSKCWAYVVAASFVTPPKTHPEFQKVAGGIAFHKIFDDFGTHYMTTVKMGARYGKTMLVEKVKVEALTKNANGFGRR